MFRDMRKEEETTISNRMDMRSGKITLPQVSVKVDHAEAVRKKWLSPKLRICLTFLVNRRKPNRPGTLRIDSVEQQPEGGTPHPG
jgi:hypothetical protein